MRWYLPDGNPLFWDELRRLLRGRRWCWLMGLDVVVLSAMLLYHIFTLPPQMEIAQRTAHYHDIWLTLMLTQAAMVLLLSPGLSAGAISGERERNTLEALLLTPLSSRAIIYGKLWSAMALLLLLLFGGLPVMAVVFMLGGVSPWEIIISHACVLVAVLLYSSLGLRASCHSQHRMPALLTAYIHSFLTLCCVPCLLCSYLYVFIIVPCTILWALWNAADLLDAMRKPVQELPPLPEINDFGFPARPAKTKSQ